MTRSMLIGSLGAYVYLGLAISPLAAQTTGASSITPNTAASNTTASKQCLADLRTFNTEMQKKGGFWRGGSDFGYGYPMDGFGYGYYPNGATQVGSTSEYRNARPGYEVRTLIASANILARQGQQQPCEDLLKTTRDVYKVYIAQMESAGASKADEPGWKQRQIAAAKPVGTDNSSFRSNELLDTDVNNSQGIALGSVEDIVMSPQTGKIAYLVVARGGLFGINEKYVPVPWDDFKISPNGDLLVLDSSKTSMDAAPRVGRNQFATWGNFEQQSQKVDAFWKTHLSSDGSD